MLSRTKSRTSSIAVSHATGMSTPRTSSAAALRSITEVLVEDVLHLVLILVEELFNDGLLSRLDVLSLAKASKYFYVTALPVIYKVATFDCHINKAVYGKSWACCSNLAKRPHLAALVRTCIIKDSYDFWDGLEHFPKQWKTAIIPALTNMVNLQELRWQRTSFSPALWKLVCSLEHLETVHFQQCSIRTLLSSKQRKKGEFVDIPCPPSLSTLTLTDVNMRHGDDEIVLQLIDAMLKSGRNVSLGMNKPIYWNHLKCQLVDPSRLKRLCILDAGSEMTLSAELVSHILKQCSELTELMLYIHSDSLLMTLQELPKEALPKLAVISTNPGVAQALVPGRKVHTACFNAVLPGTPIGPLMFLPDPGLDLSAYIRSLESLRLSATPITHFDMLMPDFETISYELPIMQRLPDILPNLRALSVHGPYNGAVNNNKLTEAVGMYFMGRLPFLEDFSFHVNYMRYRTTPGLNLNWQHEIVTQWFSVCPTLSVVQISSVIHWRRSLGQWTPALKGQDAWTRLTEGVQWLLSSNRNLVEYDWEGTLEGWLGDKRWRTKEASKEPAVLRTLQAAVQRVSLRRESPIRPSPTKGHG